MRLSIRAGLCSVALIAFAIVPNTALAAKPYHFGPNGSFTDPDFCGTGAAIDIAFIGVSNFQWLGPDSWKTTGQEKVEFTNPANGVKVEQIVAGQEQTTVTDLGDGTTLVEFSERGNPSTIRTYHGTVLVMDVGYALIDERYDADGNLLSRDIVVENGPHPNADANFTLFCSVMEDALGI